MNFLKRYFGICVLILQWAIPLTYASSDPIRLHRMNVDRDAITLSGSSSGGAVAQMMHISYSSMFKGIAVFSHNYYRCGYPNGIIEDYQNVCTKRGRRADEDLYDPENVLVDIQNYFSSGLIEDPRNLADKPLYVFTPVGSYLFTAEMSLRILKVFEPFINNNSKIKTRVQVANLTLPTNRYGQPSCTGPQNPLYVSNCGFSGALDALEFILGKHIIQEPLPEIKLQNLLQFNQTEFFYDTDGTKEFNMMDEIGFIYVPKYCQKKHAYCLLHFYFHGCLTGREFVGPNHILASGYLEIAEANRIIMVFPQATSYTVNPLGCWDTFGLTGPFYATQMGAQVSVIKRMIDRILGITEEDLIDQALGEDIERPYHHTMKSKPTKYSQYAPVVGPIDKDLLTSRSASTAYANNNDNINVLHQSKPWAQLPEHHNYNDNENLQCEETRVSENTVLKQCKPVTSSY